MKKFLVSFLIFNSLLSVPSVLAYDGGGNVLSEKHKKPPNIEYSQPSGEITVDKEGSNIKITIQNKKKFGSITIVKVDKDTGEPIEGVKFVLKDKQKGSVLAEGTTDKNGQITFDNLPLGNYFYEEISAPKPY